MSLDTLLEAAKYLEKSTKGTSKDDTAIPRANQSGALFERRRAMSESADHERRRRPGGAGTRETHNKLEKNRRAHLKECFEFLKKQVPNLEEKKTSNLNILRGALKYIQTLKKSEVDQTAERDLLTISNNMMKKRIEALTNDLQGKTSQSELVVGSDKAVIPAGSKVQKAESQLSPVSVATQTSFSNTAEGEAAASCSEKSNGNSSESSEDADTLDGRKTENGIKAECEGKCEDNDENDDENEEIDVENDDTEPREMFKKDELKEIKEEEELSTDKTEDEQMNGQANDDTKQKIPNGIRDIEVGKENDRKRPHSDDEAEEEKNAKIKGCARISC